MIFQFNNLNLSTTQPIEDGQSLGSKELDCDFLPSHLFRNGKGIVKTPNGSIFFALPLTALGCYVWKHFCTWTLYHLCGMNWIKLACNPATLWCIGLYHGAIWQKMGNMTSHSIIHVRETDYADSPVSWQRFMLHYVCLMHIRYYKELSGTHNRYRKSMDPFTVTLVVNQMIIL